MAIDGEGSRLLLLGGKREREGSRLLLGGKREREGSRLLLGEREREREGAKNLSNPVRAYSSQPNPLTAHSLTHLQLTA